MIAMCAAGPPKAVPDVIAARGNTHAATGSAASVKASHKQAREFRELAQKANEN